MEICLHPLSNVWNFEVAPRFMVTFVHTCHVWEEKRREEWLSKQMNVKLTSYACSQETRSAACNERSESYLSYSFSFIRSHRNKCSNQNANWWRVWEPTQCIGCYQFWSGLLGQNILVVLSWYIHTQITYKMIWYNAMRCNVIWYNVWYIWYDMVWYDIWYDIWYIMVYDVM
jgi:hypothetical protein